MSSLSLQQAALIRFADQGFDATSLAQIAGDAGIKKPSIYAHFRSKEALFLSLIAPTTERELTYARQNLQDGSPSVASLRRYLEDIGTRFETTPHMRFWLRLLFLPPHSLYQPVSEAMHDYMTAIEALISETFMQLPVGALAAETLACAYLGIIDSLQAELLYGGKEKYRKRLDALWQLFTVALPA